MVFTPIKKTDACGHQLYFFYRRKEIIIKPISGEGLKALFDNKILKNTSRGFVTYNDNIPVGHYRTKGAAKQMYIEDRYANKAKSLVEGDMHR